MPGFSAAHDVTSSCRTVLHVTILAPADNRNLGCLTEQFNIHSHIFYLKTSK